MADTSRQPHAATTTASLDLSILTFNAGKEQINSSVFADHLRDAFANGSTVLPEIIVVYVGLPAQASLQMLTFLFL